MRILAAFGILTALGGPVRAEVEGAAIAAVPRTSLGLYVTGHGGAVRGVTEGGVGPTLELALGAGRTQYFVEGSLAWVSMGEPADRTTGVMARGGVGVRWIARSFQLDDRAGLEMTLEAVGGLHRIWWAGDHELTRPELGLGWGWQVRHYGKPRFAVRFGFRVFFAPAGESPAAMTTCRGRCTASAEARTNGGLMFSIGGAL